MKRKSGSLKKEWEKNEVTIEFSEMLNYLPHRHPFILVDRIVEIAEGERIAGIKNVTGSEYFFPGHFPGQPVMPGVLIVEALAQCATILANYTEKGAESEIFYFAGIEKARFKKPVTPGDTVHLIVEVDKVKSRLWKVNGRAEVDGLVVTEAAITAMKAK